MIDSISSLSDGERLYQSYRPEITQETEGYLPIPEEMENNTGKDLSTRVQLLSSSENRFSVYKIDQCVRVKTLSDSFRNQMVQFWKDARLTHCVRAWTAVVGFGVTFPLAIYYTPFFGIGSAISLAIAAYSISKSNGAKEQFEGWERRPVEAVAAKRRQAYEQGFPFVYRNRLKLTGPSDSALLLPVEVQHLHNRYWSHFCSELLGQNCATSKQKKAWLDQFRSTHPTSEPVLQYVYGHVPDVVRELSRNVDRVSDSLRNIEKDFHRIRQQRTDETQTILDLIESKRRLAKMPCDLALTYFLSRLDKDKSDQLEEWRFQEGATIAKRNEIESDYRLKVAAYRLMHTALDSQINSYFDSKKREAEEALQKILKKIKKQEADAFSPYYDYCKQLVTNALAAKDGKPIVSEAPFSPAQALQIPSLPKIEVNFVLQLPAGVSQEFLQAMQQKGSVSVRYS